MPRNNLIRRRVRIRNPASQPVKTWLEPQAEQFQLLPGEYIDFVFIGPRNGIPELLPSENGVAVYGWHGSHGVAMRDCKFLGMQPTVAQIVQRTMDNAALSLDADRAASLFAEVDMIQRSIDSDVVASRESQKALCKMAAYLADELASGFPNDESILAAIREITQQLVSVRGVYLADDGASSQAAGAEGDFTPSKFLVFVISRAYTFLDGPIKLFADSRTDSNQADDSVTPHSADAD
jgi:hypothetical protein